MPFEALAHVAQLKFSGVPPQWSPLVFSFDADLPLFPLLYFHVLPNNLGQQRPSAQDRAYGYVRSVSIDIATQELTAEVICNKDLNSGWVPHFAAPVKDEVAHRLGVANPVTLTDIDNVFGSSSEFANRVPVLREMWHRVVGSAYGGALPFGKFWDPVWGLARAFASFYSPAGRKSEVIQTHYFCTRFGEPVASSASVPFIQFHLLPTWQELTDVTNPLSVFPRFSSLVQGSNEFCSLPKFGSFDLSNWSYTGFKGKGGASITTAFFRSLVGAVKGHYQEALMECFNAFDKGPVRSLIFLMLLNDIRQINATIRTPAGAKNPRLNPSSLSASDAADIALNLEHQQSKKVLSIYAQQAHANPHCFPMDTWITAMLAHPLDVAAYNYTAGTLRGDAINLGRVKKFISSAVQLGKVERLLWVSAQARKVHSAACDDALWCIKASGQEYKARGANPLTCRACHHAIRSSCPAYFAKRKAIVGFNGTKAQGLAAFNITTSAADNTTPGQKFVACASTVALDKDTAIDSPQSFNSYPSPNHVLGNPMTMEDFVNTY
jgi:hypothetical protein